MESKYLQHQKSFNDEFSKLPVFWAFGNDQFNEGVKKLGLAENDFDKICRIQGGGFLLKSAKQDYIEFFQKRDKELNEILSDENEMIEAIAYEMMNREYFYSYDKDDIFDALGIEQNEKNLMLFEKAKTVYKSKYHIED